MLMRESMGFPGGSSRHGKAKSLQVAGFLLLLLVVVDGWLVDFLFCFYFVLAFCLFFIESLCSGNDWPVLSHWTQKLAFAPSPVAVQPFTHTVLSLRKTQ